VQVLEKMVYNSVHRVYITNENQRPLGVVTMSGAMRRRTIHTHIGAYRSARADVPRATHHCSSPRTCTDVLQLFAVDPESDTEGWLESPITAF
jgi:signal-transduction protein with cAMP-binding, CBS, and nucleotidyltransferase domain